MKKKPLTEHIIHNNIYVKISWDYKELVSRRNSWLTADMTAGKEGRPNRWLMADRTTAKAYRQNSWFTTLDKFYRFCKWICDWPPRGKQNRGQMFTMESYKVQTYFLIVQRLPTCFPQIKLFHFLKHENFITVSEQVSASVCKYATVQGRLILIYCFQLSLRQEKNGFVKTMLFKNF